MAPDQPQSRPLSGRQLSFMGLAAAVLVAFAGAGWWWWAATRWSRAPIASLSPLPDDRVLVLRQSTGTAGRSWQISLVNADGEEAWASVVDASLLADPTETRSTPLIAADVDSEVGMLATSYGFSLTDGRELWRYSGPPRAGKEAFRNAFLHEGTLLANYATMTIAIDARTGAERWRTPLSGSRRFFRFPGRVIVESEGSAPAALDLVSGKATPIGSVSCRAQSELVVLRTDGVEVRSGSDLAIVRQRTQTMPQLREPRCGVQGAQVIVAGADGSATRILALDRQTLEIRWNLELQPDGSSSANVPVGEMWTMADVLPRYWPARLGNTRYLVDLDRGLIAETLPLDTGDALGPSQGFALHDGRAYAVEQGTIMLLSDSGPGHTAEARSAAISRPPVFTESFIWLYDEARLGRLRASDLGVEPGSEWLVDEGWSIWK